MNEGILEVTREGRIVYANPAALTLIGMSESELLTTKLANLFMGNDRDRFQNLLETMTASQQCPRCFFEDRPFKLDGRLVLLRVLPIKDKMSKAIVMFSDVTEQVRIEKQLQQAKKMEAIGTLAGGVAHAFNNALTVIIGYITLAKNYSNPEDAIRQKLEEAEQAAIKARELTQRLMPFSREDPPTRLPASLGAIIKDACLSSLVDKEIECAISVPEDLWEVRADPDQIREALQNVMINAAEATPAGGVINAFAENLELKDAADLQLHPGEYVKISVQDHGPGIPDEYLSKIYDPYFTTKEMGRGLGLATAYSIIARHDGHISAKSEVGLGTTFALYLKACRQATDMAEHSSGLRRKSKGRILIMDDDETVQEILGEMIKSLGYTIHSAMDGAEAITMYTSARESGEPFDAVIMDLTISRGMGGLETVQRLVKIDPEAKAVVSTGYSDEPAMLEYSKYGFSGALDKPFKLRDLKALLESLVRNN